MPTLTVFTATYNRGHLIGRIYEALLRQSSYDFEWLVVDDGSTDNTSELFETYLSRQNPFNIRYYRQENQGLISALNKGVQFAQGKYLSKIDSDDYPVDTFAENVLQWINEISGVSTVYAVGGLKVTSKGCPLKGSWPSFKNWVDASDLERAKYNIDADLQEAWSVEILKRYQFPLWKGEKFAPEQIVFHQIALNGYKIRWHAQPLTVCEYQEGGLTLGASKLERMNPMGYAMMFNQKLNRKDLYFMERVKTAMNHIALSWVGKNPLYIVKSNDKLFTFLVLLPGTLLALRRMYQYYIASLKD